MKDTRKTPKVASKPEKSQSKKDSIETGTVNSKPGIRDYPFIMDDLTEAEYAIVAALRSAREVEESFDAFDRREAWFFIQSMTEGLRRGEKQEELSRICDPDQFGVIFAAAMASAEAIRTLSASWREGRKQVEQEEAERRKSNGKGKAIS